MGKTEGYFLSSDGIHNIHTITWEPEGEIKAVLQIVHGMVEFVDRYDHFARFLNDKGILVVGHDHLGHGKSVNNESEWGFFAKEDSTVKVVSDIRNLFETTRNKYPDVPYFILGHSMGSYLLRTYLTKYSDDIDGAIIMGTGTEANIATSFGKCFASVVAKFKGWDYRSVAVASLSQGGPYKSFDCTGKVPEKSWLTKDVDIVKWYYNEPACTYLFTLNGYYTLFDAVSIACDKNKMKLVNKDLPLLIVSGKDDPVGNMGQGVVKAKEGYVEAGVKSVDMILYENDRHEILNETDKDKVMEDIYNWLNKRI